MIIEYIMPVEYTIDIHSYNTDKINTKSCISKDIQYSILKYDEKVVCDNDEKLGLYRSIVLAEPEKKIVSYSPPKSITMDLFQERNPVLTEDILVNEVIEGPLLTLFWDDRINAWELASKGAIGGNYWFYRTQYKGFSEQAPQPTFRSMFLDVLRAGPDQDINDLPILQELPKGNPGERFCYNFVLQHQDNHIVLEIHFPVLYLVSVYVIGENKITAVPPETYQEWNVFYIMNGLVQFPWADIEKESGYEGLKETYCSIHSPHTMVGLMFLNVKTGDRACLENPTYAEVRELRGNNPNLQYQYLCLRKIEKVDDFLKYFPQYKRIFYGFYKQYEEFITNTHQSYVKYYVKKTGEIISKKYFPLIYKIHHEVFIPSIATGEKLIMRRAEIKKYILNLSPTELIYYLNYNKDQLVEDSA
jgi:hypothetical protein